jgi:SAM-dependent methyltransferase
VRVLDVSAGERHVWFNKSHPDAIFLDIRPEVKPDVVGDSRNLGQFGSGWFDLVVFDPPHGNIGPNGAMKKRYGSFDMPYIRDLIVRSEREIYRVLKADGLLAFKWNDRQVKLAVVLAWMPSFDPLFGHHVSSAQARPSTTYWVMLRKRESFDCAPLWPLGETVTDARSIRSADANPESSR